MVNSADDVIIRPAKSLQEVSDLWWPLMVELGWNRDPDDAITHYRVGGDGAKWILAARKDNDKPEGCVVAFTYPNGTGWIGFFCVNAPFRQNGLGRLLWRGLEDEYLSTNTLTIGLDGVEQQVPTYTRRGYQVCARIPLMMRPSLLERPMATKIPELSNGEKVVDIRDVEPRALAAVDLAHTGLDRTVLWTEEALFSRQDAYGYAIVSGGDLTGFVLVRRCEQGHRVGPLYAETYAQGQTLLELAMNRVRDVKASLVAEIFGTNANAKKLFEELGWDWAGIDYTRMWLGGRVTKEQQADGKGARGMFATFDACAG
ncbi:hypothetical protein EJ04DRAFT_580790 [Polyplosphaeria fusca]|uniref:N-acetyltransferase domain-containing protein n=1 Tax=Polyplosphaeria fusca TaxID=682080 RepID=A0A9P4QPN9_9PLEO|nr:hypothetical protein EJ04DRAFT_580790 [Polyplosphaeria fusca]